MTTDTVPNPLPTWSLDITLDEFREFGRPVNFGSAERRVFWLSHAAVDWLRDAPARQGHLRAGVVLINPGTFRHIYAESEDAYVLEGIANVHLPGQLAIELRPGTAVAISAGSTVDWLVDEPLRLFVVFAGHRDSDNVSPGIATTTFEEATLRAYTDDSLLSGQPVRTIQWLREGPEGTGGFFSGLFTIQPGSYRKQFVVNEFVLVLAGEKRMEVGGAVGTLSAGQVGAFSKGWVCDRSITLPVRQFFAGR